MRIATPVGKLNRGFAGRLLSLEAPALARVPEAAFLPLAVALDGWAALRRRTGGPGAGMFLSASKSSGTPAV